MFFKKQTQMELEILEQPAIIGAFIEGHVENYVLKIDLPSKIQSIKIVASGSSYNCGLLGKRFFEEIAQIDTKIEF